MHCYCTACPNTTHNSNGRASDDDATDTHVLIGVARLGPALVLLLLPNSWPESWPESWPDLWPAVWPDLQCSRHASNMLVFVTHINTP